MHISIVIACLNGAATLTDQLDILRIECVGVPWEVIVADNGSTEGVGQFAPSISAPPFRFLDASDRRGQAHAPNVGAQLASGQELLFLDQGDMISPGYVLAMGSAIQLIVSIARSLRSQDPDSRIGTAMFVSGIYAPNVEVFASASRLRVGPCSLGISSPSTQGS